MARLGLLQFEEGCFERIWGGRRLETLFGKPLPAGQSIGEDWLISDHASFESRVARGPHRGKTIQDLLKEDARALLGTRANPTPQGRFPLLLKLLDAADVLSVQVHPDDETARRLGEPDPGKTEMWHVLHAEPRSPIYCGVKDGVTREIFARAARDGTVEDLLVRLEAQRGDSIFIPAGTVHAIGAGLVLAEIQQNSDVTYRCFDWNRVDANGNPRELHLDKALEATHFGEASAESCAVCGYTADDGSPVEVLGACRYFAAEAVEVAGNYRRVTHGTSFHIILARRGPVSVRAGGDCAALDAGAAVLVPGCLEAFEVDGVGAILDYYVPDLALEIVAPLRAAGHSDDTIVRLGGVPSRSDVKTAL
jgi:mannose-6-phosphate isomerase